MALGDNSQNSFGLSTMTDEEVNHLVDFESLVTYETFINCLGFSTRLQGRQTRNFPLNITPSAESFWKIDFGPMLDKPCA